MIRNPELPRCTWARNDALMQDYHDTEWGVPQHDDRLLWETLMLEGFQAGLSWITVLRKRATFREVFCDFNPYQVAAFTENDVQRLLGNPGIIRARAKIEGTITNARIYCHMAAQGKSFRDFCWHFTNGQILEGDGVTLATSSPLSVEISVALKKWGFKFIGPTIAYAWMQAVGIVNNHSAECFCRQR
ncbi:MAG: DNA-3-methyladenine glycosylase I [Sodalis sp. (in: enterobacteria)]